MWKLPSQWFNKNEEINEEITDATTLFADLDKCKTSTEKLEFLKKDVSKLNCIRTDIELVNLLEKFSPTDRAPVALLMNSNKIFALLQNHPTLLDTISVNFDLFQSSTRSDIYLAIQKILTAKIFLQEESSITKFSDLLCCIKFLDESLQMAFLKHLGQNKIYQLIFKTKCISKSFQELYISLAKKNQLPFLELFDPLDIYAFLGNHDNFISLCSALPDAKARINFIDFLIDELADFVKTPDDFYRLLNQLSHSETNTQSPPVKDNVMDKSVLEEKLKITLESELIKESKAIIHFLLKQLKRFYPTEQNIIQPVVTTSSIFKQPNDLNEKPAEITINQAIHYS